MTGQKSMGHQKFTETSKPTTGLINSQNNHIHLEKLLRTAHDAMIALDQEGRIVAINKKAAQLLGKTHKKLIDQNICQQIKLDTFEKKRQFIHARRYFIQAKAGIPQQFTWVESRSDKPIAAFNIVINKSEIEGTSLFFVKLIDVLQEKITEWVLWSLAKIGNHQEINGVIDEILKLASEAFSADHAAVSLLDNQHIAHTVSYYHLGERQENISYSLADSPCEKIQSDKHICYFNDVQEQFAKDQLLKKMNINTYLGGPIISTQDNVVGLMTILTVHKLEMNQLNTTLFRLFLGRVNLEIERLLSQRKLQFLASIPQQDPNPIIRIQPTGEVIFANTQGKAILKYWRQRYSALPDMILREAYKAQLSNQVIRVEMEAENKIYLFTLIAIPDFKQINIYGTDISQLKTTEQNMINLARVDALTQIANRQYFEEKLIEKIQEHLLEGNELALLLIDLDDFKTINDTLGHPIGDMLLKAATKRMVRCLRKEDFIARLGGDEFIVLLNKSNANSTAMVAEKMISVLSRAFQFGEYHMKITASIGIAFYPRDGLTIGDLLKHSDIAMYQAKREGKNNYTVFSKTLHFIQDKRNEVIRRELKLAAIKNELYIDYQPIIDLHSNKIIGLEALLRWVHPEQGLILPNEFINIAEQTGSIHLISQWLIDKSMQDFATIQSIYLTTKLSINISLSQINDARFLDTFCDNLKENNISKDRIILDISERIIAPHFQQIAKNMRKIHNLGLKICLDNFGSPQVSLPKLLALPLDFIKLDQLLLLGTERSSKHQMLLKGIVNLAQELHLKVIQKGIETEAQHEVVKKMGCQFAQGFYYSKPLRIDELRTFL